MVCEEREVREKIRSICSSGVRPARERPCRRRRLRPSVSAALVGSSVSLTDMSDCSASGATTRSCGRRVVGKPFDSFRFFRESEALVAPSMPAFVTGRRKLPQLLHRRLLFPGAKAHSVLRRRVCGLLLRSGLRLRVWFLDPLLCGNEGAVDEIDEALLDDEKSRSEGVVWLEACRFSSSDASTCGDSESTAWRRGGGQVEADRTRGVLRVKTTTRGLGLLDSWACLMSSDFGWVGVLAHYGFTCGLRWFGPMGLLGFDPLL
ncbi:hypothetical protein Rs2_04181 [Raphanus sativus]|nr:hypothetical protein Rs2_04181 [Raphanus sativus]